MTNKAHKSLTGTDLHENKGVSSASNGQVATASGGVTVWQKLTATNLTGTGNPFGAQLFHAVHSVPSGTDSGAISGDTWTTRPLNSALTNEISSASLSNNQVSLPAGTYYIQAYGEGASGSRRRKMRWRNITDGTTTVVGSSGGNSSGSSPHSEPSSLAGRFTIAGTKVFELQHYAEVAAASNAFGSPTGSGEVEIYTIVQIWKVA
jgi:hypothetical protein